MNPTPPAATTVWTNAGWHLYQFDIARNQCDWLQLSEAQYRNASFLDQRLLASAPEPVSVSMADLQSLLPGRAANTVHFIFHIGHCGSTLISRAMAATPAVLPVREPVTLRQLSSIQMPQQQWQACLEIALAAHGRSFHAGQVCMVKATSTCNALVQPIARAIPDARMLLLYVPLGNYLAGMLGKQTPAMDLQGHAALRLQEWQAITGEEFPLAANAMNEPQLAVLAWLTSISRLLQAQKSLGERCLLLDFDQFLAQPESGLEKLIGFFGLENARDEIVDAWPEISLGYSKQPDQPYSAFNRNRTLSRGRQFRGSEIQAGLDWAGELIRQYPALQTSISYM